MRELLQQALDELKHARIFITTKEKMHPTGVGIYDELLNSIKAELAKPEQEPVAYVTGYYNGRCVIAPTDFAWSIPSGTAFYTSPPRKEWVGLTDDDYPSIRDGDHAFHAGWTAAEIKLKSKNER